MKTDAQPTFTRKAWIATGIVALTIVLLWIIKATFNVFLLILAGALIAIYFRGLAGLLHQKLRLPQKWSLPVSIIGSLLLLALFFWLAGSRISQQATELSSTLPQTIESVETQLNSSPVGRQVLSRVSGKENMQKISATVQSFFRSTFGVLGDIYVVLFLGLFFTAAPKTYLQGFVRLMPEAARARTGSLLEHVGETLRKWLKGQIFAMLIVTVLTAAGLLIMGMPMALTLALIAGLLNFIPNFGPLIAMVPAVLVGFIQGPSMALAVAGLYIGVQVVESNIITPQIQKRMIEIPPALIILAQLFMGVLTGGWGLVLATPLVAIVMVVVGDLWVKKNESE